VRIFGSKDACARYRPALTDWVEHRTQGPLTPSAFDHLARCRRCEVDLTEIAQTVIALRRMGERASALEPTADGWHDLRARLEASRGRRDPARRSRWALFGSMLGPAIVAVLALRIAMPAAPLGAVLTDDGLAGPSVSSSVPRPMYDSGSRRLTEGIVLVLAGRTRPSESHSTGPSVTPSSTDRRDLPSAVRRATLQTESTLPHTATRS
jgi:predicted anti-sigma-YlaC factor YlaD